MVALQEFMTAKDRRRTGKMVFEGLLTELEEYGLINSWQSVAPGSLDHKRGAHYLVETDHGQVPLAVYLKPTKATFHRSRINFPAISLRSQNTGLFKENEDMLADVSGKIVNYLIANKMISPVAASRNELGG